MAGRLPEKFYPHRLARADARFEGTLPPSKMPRLADVCTGTVADAVVRLDFGTSETGLPRLSGTAATEVEIECQRCLEPMTVQLRANIELAVITPGDDGGRARADASGLEVMEVGEEAIDTATFIEDELLLAAPDYPMHGKPGEEPCRIDDEFAPVAESTESPFAALGDLLSGTDGPMEPRGNSH